MPKQQCKSTGVNTYAYRINNYQYNLYRLHYRSLYLTADNILTMTLSLM